ncbi:MAG TPA: hypothetical protein VKF32_15040 [Thermoanaerobaculia bacterium]|nr:hypothetical protein [Thermoanaerobaculia bacterium]
MRKKHAAKDFPKMTVSELRAATKEFGRELVAREFRPMSDDERRRWEIVRQRPGRPRRGAGAKVISVSVERRLLAQSDALAKNLGITRASLVERGLKAVLAAEGRL